MANVMSDVPHYSKWTGSQIDDAMTLIQQNYESLLKMPDFHNTLNDHTAKLQELIDITLKELTKKLFDDHGNPLFVPITGGVLKGDRPQISSNIQNITPSEADGFSLLYYPEISGYNPFMTANFQKEIMSFGAFTSPEPSMGWYWGNELLAYVDKGGCLMGACWNDFAEFRKSDETEPGRVVCENGDGTMSRSYKRLQPGAMIVSDTFGFAIGKTEGGNTPVAVAGRVLAYPYEDWWCFEPGQPVCAGPNGTVSMMSRREARKYPDRIIGTVSELPTYEKWGKHNTLVNGRIWIKVK